jgi:hypothetical protein
LYSVGCVPSLPQEAESTIGYFLPETLQDRRAALVVAHPGHELRVHGWMELAHPFVCVLTDGSGHSGQSRLESTTRLLAKTGAPLGSIYGRVKDIEIYTAILDSDFGLFRELAEELGKAFVRDAVEYVVGDAIEGYNPIHDLCRSVINAAVELANRSKTNRIANFDFLVIGLPDLKSDEARSREVWMRLDEVALARKLEAAKSYLELRDDVGKMINETGSASFRFEALRPVISAVGADGLIQEPPFYERYGEKQVSEGYYRRVIRYREHILPIVDALQSYAQR